MNDFQNTITLTESAKFKTSISTFLVADMDVDAEGKVSFTTQIHSGSKALILLVFLLSVIQDLKYVLPEITEMLIEKLTVMFLQRTPTSDIAKVIKDINNKEK